jgi:hypothetical protein
MVRLHDLLLQQNRESPDRRTAALIAVSSFARIPPLDAPSLMVSFSQARKVTTARTRPSTIPIMDMRKSVEMTVVSCCRTWYG